MRVRRVWGMAADIMGRHSEPEAKNPNEIKGILHFVQDCSESEKIRFLSNFGPPTIR